MTNAGRWGWIALTAGLAGCQNARVAEMPPIVGNQASALTNATPLTKAGVDRVQAQVMDFADDFTLRLADMADRIEARRPPMEARIAIHRLRYTVAHGLTVIASSANPKVALIDSVVVMSLQRRLVEERLIPKYFEDMPWIAAVFRDAEDQIKRYAAETLTPEQMDEIQTLVDKWIEDNPYRYYAAYVRLNDFASTRQQTQHDATNGRSSSLFGLLFLDPLAGLDPTTREIEQTRLFAERAMYYLQRMPQLASWQAELLYIDTASEPEVEQALANMQSLTTSVEILTADVADMKAELPAIISSEREAAIDQASQRFFEGFAAERGAMLDDLAARSDELEGTLKTLTSTLEAGDEFAAHGTELVQAVHDLTDTINAMRGSPGTDGEPAPGAASEPGSNGAGESTSIADYEHAIETATTLVGKLDDLVTAVDELARSNAWEERRATLDNAMGDAQTRVDASIDHAYRRGLTLVVVTLAGLLGVGLVLKLVPTRSRA